MPVNQLSRRDMKLTAWPFIYYFIFYYGCNTSTFNMRFCFGRVRKRSLVIVINYLLTLLLISRVRWCIGRDIARRYTGEILQTVRSPLAYLSCFVPWCLPAVAKVLAFLVPGWHFVLTTAESNSMTRKTYQMTVGSRIHRTQSQTVKTCNHIQIKNRADESLEDFKMLSINFHPQIGIYSSYEVT